MSPKTLTYIFGFLIFGALCIIIAVFVGYRQFSENPERLISAIPKGADIAIEKIRHSSIKDGVKEWVLDADSAQYADASKQALLKTIRATFFLKDGREMVLSADEGILKTDSKDIEVRGNVVVLNPDFRLETDSISYDGARRTLLSETPVRLTGDQIDLTANGMTVDLNTNRTVFEGDVRGIIRENIRFEK